MNNVLLFNIFVSLCLSASIDCIKRDTSRENLVFSFLDKTMLKTADQLQGIIARFGKFWTQRRIIENTRLASFDIKFTRQGFENAC